VVSLEDVTLLDGGSPATRGIHSIKKRADWEKIRLTNDQQLQTVWQANMIPADWQLIGEVGVNLHLCNKQSGKETAVMVKSFCNFDETEPYFTKDPVVPDSSSRPHPINGRRSFR
jgi:hypothetical protein